MGDPWKMKIRNSAQIEASRGMRRATSNGWLRLSPVMLVLALILLAPLAASGDGKASKQLEFGTDMAKRGLWSEALFRFRQADSLEPGNVRILNNIAVSYEALGLFDQALEAYQAALRASPEDRRLRSNYSSFAEFYQNFRPRDEEAQQEAADRAEDQPLDEVGS
jgi:tetratricopeptide (TPR) repeat protein